MRSLDEYRTLVFDCDGVVLNSNRVKSDAFYNAALPYGEAEARALLKYNQANGGISRFKKFDYFFKDILVREAKTGEKEWLLKVFADEVVRGLMTCRVADGLTELKEATQQGKWMMVSGGAQDELRTVFRDRRLDHLFEAGILGSPDSKPDILRREINSGNLKLPAVFFGDSRLDHESVQGTGIDFVFVSGWSEFSEWREYRQEKGFEAVERLGELIAGT